jgi:two-component system cell cycle sensor histidine kinase/response regulator CckA
MFGVIVLIFALLLVGLKIIQSQKQTHATQALIALVDNDAPPCFLTNTEGQISFRNEAASERFKDRAVETLGRAFTKLLANPGSVLYRLQSKAHALGGAREDIVTRKGHVRLSVSAVKPATYICRIGAAVHARPTHLVCPS